MVLQQKRKQGSQLSKIGFVVFHFCLDFSLQSNIDEFAHHGDPTKHEAGGILGVRCVFSEPHQEVSAEVGLTRAHMG